MPNWVRKVYKFFVHHNTLTAITFLLFGVGCYCVYKSNEPDKMGTIASLATALAIIVAMIQLLASNRQHRETSRRAAAEKAIDLAKYFQSDLCSSISFMTSALGAIGYSKYEESKSLISCHLRFSREELTSFFGENVLKDISIADSKITSSIIRYASVQAAHALPADQQPIDANYNFFAERIDLLNTLEWFAMTLNTGVADENVIYQSLHQLILSYIRLEYPTIAKYNTDASGADQYFTNIIQLYNRWQARESEQRMIDQRNRDKNLIDNDRLQKKMRNRRKNNVKYPPSV